MGHRQAFEFSLFSPAGRLRPSLSGRNATIPRTFAVGQDARSTWATSIPRRSSRCECRRSSFTEEQIQRSRSLPAQETRKHRHRFAGNHRARLNVNGTTGTEPFRYREKIAEFRCNPRLPGVSGPLWRELIRRIAAQSGHQPTKSLPRATGWRRGGDSNPRNPFEFTRVPGVRLKPGSATSPLRRPSNLHFARKGFITSRERR
jgi:hypothetical protein